MEANRADLKFAADRMLGRLVKWLRVIGQDVIYGQHLSGYGLIRAARAEGRLILTRDGHLKHKQPPPFLFIDSDHYRDQLRQVITACGLKPAQAMFTRCIECNTRLQVKSKESVAGIVAALCLFEPRKVFLVPDLPEDFLGGDTSAENAR